jgi:hypothetical protein
MGKYHPSSIVAEAPRPGKRHSAVFFPNGTAVAQKICNPKKCLTIPPKIAIYLQNSKGNSYFIDTLWSGHYFSTPLLSRSK